jgi:hypothetical protein
LIGYSYHPAAVQIYAIEDSEIRIYAVSHRRRRPGYWLDRLPLI